MIQQIDESLVSRMNRIATGIPMELIHAIGPAHGVGRRVWEKLFRLCEKDVARAREVAREIPRNLPGPDRLDAAVTLLTATKATTPKVEQGERVKIGRKGNRITIDVESVEALRHNRIRGRSRGHLRGEGIWLLRTDGPFTDVTYVWRVELDKPWMRWLAPLLAPVFRWNHDSVMRAGGAGLARHLATHGP